MEPHSLTNFKIQKYHQDDPKFNDAYSRYSLTLILKLIGLLCMFIIMALLISILLVEHILKETKIFINNKNIKTNIFRIQAHDSIMSGYFCIRFIDFMFATITFTEFTNLFSLNNCKKNDDITLNYFTNNV